MSETNGTKPTQDEFNRAWHLTKGYDLDGNPIPGADAYTSSEIKHEDTATAVFRHHLGPRWSSFPLDAVRHWAEDESKAGREWGVNKRTANDRTRCLITNLIEQSIGNRSDSHSQEYIDIHESEEFRNIARSLKAEYDYTCQLCNRSGFNGKDLEAHITDYKNWRTPGKILILCKEFCHPVADELLRYVNALDSDCDIQDLFNMNMTTEEK